MRDHAATATNPSNVTATDSDVFRARSYRTLFPRPTAILILIGTSFLLLLGVAWWKAGSSIQWGQAAAANYSHAIFSTIIMSLIQMTNRFPGIEVSSRGIVRCGLFQREAIITWGSIRLISKPNPSQLQILTIHDKVITINDGDFGLPLSTIEAAITARRAPNNNPPSLKTDVVSREWRSTAAVFTMITVIVTIAFASASYAVMSRFFPQVQPWYAVGPVIALVIISGEILIYKSLRSLPTLKMDANEITVRFFRVAPIVLPWKNISQLRMTKPTESGTSQSLQLQPKNGDPAVIVPWTNETSGFLLKLIARAKDKGIEVAE